MSDYDNIGLTLPMSFNIADAKSWKDEETFYSFFENNDVSCLLAIDILIKVNTVFSMYVLIRILGVESIISRLGWETPSRKDISALSKDYNKFYFYKVLQPNLLCVLHSGILPIQKLMDKPIRDLTYEDFYKAFDMYLGRRNRLMKNPVVKNYVAVSTPSKKKKKFDNSAKYNDTGNVYERYDYGLSDW